MGGVWSAEGWSSDVGQRRGSRDELVGGSLARVELDESAGDRAASEFAVQILDLLGWAGLERPSVGVGGLAAGANALGADLQRGVEVRW
jgi:hypothetical protein